MFKVGHLSFLSLLIGTQKTCLLWKVNDDEQNKDEKSKFRDKMDVFLLGVFPKNGKGGEKLFSISYTLTTTMTREKILIK